MNGTEFFTDRNSLYDWAVGEPNNEGGEDCVHIYPSGLNDRLCYDTYWEREGLPYHGLCEIKKVENCIV